MGWQRQYLSRYHTEGYSSNCCDLYSLDVASQTHNWDKKTEENKETKSTSVGVGFGVLAWIKDSGVAYREWRRAWGCKWDFCSSAYWNYRVCFGGNLEHGIILEVMGSITSSFSVSEGFLLEDIVDGFWS